jgi:hypothetical protein
LNPQAQKQGNKQKAKGIQPQIGSSQCLPNNLHRHAQGKLKQRPKPNCEHYKINTMSSSIQIHPMPATTKVPQLELTRLTRNKQKFRNF